MKAMAKKKCARRENMIIKIVTAKANSREKEFL
jgi:hypothetical protein